MGFAFQSRDQAQPPRWRSDERAWLITRYADATHVLKSDDVSIIEVAKNIQKLSDRMNGAFANTILLLGTSHPFQNAPMHAGIRAGLKALLGDISRRWTTDRVDALAIRLLTSAGSLDCLEAVRHLAKPMPAAIIADSLGLELKEVYRAGELTQAVSAVWSRDVHALRELATIEENAVALVQLLTEKWSDRRRGDLAGLAFLTLAGVVTSSGLLGSAIRKLSSDRDIQDRLRADPAMVNGFINETLRSCPPARRIYGRRTEREMTLSSVTIPPGASLIVDIEAAHCDPDAYPQPERFDIARTGPPNLAFSTGAHACVGVALARLEAKVLIERLLHDYIIVPAGDAKLRPSRDWYEYESVPIRLQRI